MNEVGIVILLAIMLSGILVWLLIPGRGASKTASAAFAGAGKEVLLPTAKHYAYFPQIRRALSGEDSEYLMRNAPPPLARQALRERRAVARGFLRGLHEDFTNLARLGRIIASLSPEVSHEQERERLMLSLRFQVLYALVWLRLSTGTLPLQQLEYLTGLVGRLAKRMDESMAQVSALSAGQLSGGLGA